MSHLIEDRYSQDILEFCDQHNLGDYLELAVNVLQQGFPDAQRVVVEMEVDPESTDRWIQVEAFVPGLPKEIRMRHKACVRQIVNQVPWSQFTLIRTSYTPKWHR